MEEKKKTGIYIVIILILVIILGVILYMIFKDDGNSTKNAAEETNTESSTAITEVEVKYNSYEEQQDYTDYDAEIDLSKLSSTGSGVTVSNNTIMSYQNDLNDLYIFFKEDLINVTYKDMVKYINSMSNFLSNSYSDKNDISFTFLVIFKLYIFNKDKLTISKSLKRISLLFG